MEIRVRQGMSRGECYDASVVLVPKLLAFKKTDGYTSKTRDESWRML